MSLLAVARAFGVVCMLPIGFSWLNFSLRILLAFLFATFVGVVPVLSTFPDLLAEFLLGLILGFPLALTVSSGAMLGELLDVGRGQSLGSIYDPINQTVEPVSANLIKMLFLATCLMLGAGERLVVGFVESTKRLPIGKICILANSHTGSDLLIALSKILGLHFQLLLPIVALLLCIDLGVLWIGKLGLNTNLNCEAFQLKTALGMLFLYLLWRNGIASSLGSLMLPPPLDGFQ